MNNNLSMIGSNFLKLGPYILQGLGLILTFLAPIKIVVIAVLVLVVIDFITGLLAAKKLKEPITSKKMRDSIGKFSAYVLAIIASHTFQKIFGIEAVDIAKIISFIIGFVELKSIIENVGKIVGWSLWDKVKSILSGKKSLKDLMGEDEEGKN